MLEDIKEDVVDVALLLNVIKDSCEHNNYEPQNISLEIALNRQNLLAEKIDDLIMKNYSEIKK